MDKGSNKNKRRRLARYLLWLYPQVWRERYLAEMEELLQEHPLTNWTLIDLFLGSIDAHLHVNLIPGRLTAMTYRLRNSEIVIFCAFVFYTLAWLAVRLVRDPLAAWQQATQQHPEIKITLNIVDGLEGLALLGVAAGALPLLITIFAFAFKKKRWDILGLLAVPPLAFITLVGYLLVLGPASTQKVNGNTAPEASLTPLAFLLQMGFVILLLAGVIASLVSITLCLKKSQLDKPLLDLILLPAGIVTLGITGGLVGTIVLIALLYTEAPQLTSVVPLAVSLIVMLATGLITLTAFRQGWIARANP
ncbi:MAG: hypothetical protein J0H83_19465 [Candidatus Melainabacteria bacterium]|nr:hypothetical protein [Candidatus Melainabacteria bacterium]